MLACRDRCPPVNQAWRVMYFSSDEFVADSEVERLALLDAQEAISNAGRLSDLAEAADFAHRFAHLYAQCPAIAEGIDTMQMRGPATFAFMRNENLLDAVECLVGPEITCSPIQHLRAKPPASAEGAG